MIRCTRTDQAPYAAIISPGTSASNKSLSLSLICRAFGIFQRSRRVCRVKLLIPLQGKSPRFFQRARGYRCWCFRNLTKTRLGLVNMYVSYLYIDKHLLVCTWNPETYLNTKSQEVWLDVHMGIYRLTSISLSRRSLAFCTSKFCENCLILSWWHTRTCFRSAWKSETMWNHVKLLKKNGECW